MSQTELAERAKIGLQTVNRLENMKQNPRLSNIEAIAKALGCPKEQLYTDPDSRPAAPQTPIEAQIEALVSVIAKQGEQLLALQSQIEALRPKPSDGKGREPSGVYQTDAETIVTTPETQATPQESRLRLNPEQEAVIAAFERGTEREKELVRVALGLSTWRPRKKRDTNPGDERSKRKA